MRTAATTRTRGLALMLLLAGMAVFAGAAWAVAAFVPNSLVGPTYDAQTGTYVWTGEVGLVDPHDQVCLDIIEFGLDQFSNACVLTLLEPPGTYSYRCEASLEIDSFVFWSLNARVNDCTNETDEVAGPDGFFIPTAVALAAFQGSAPDSAASRVAAALVVATFAGLLLVSITVVIRKSRAPSP